jgi:hypothetical protein
MSRRLLVPSRLALKFHFRPSPKSVVSRAMVLALVVAGCTVLGSGQALASHVSCGDTITTDTTLDSDLVNCPNNGTVISANKPHPGSQRPHHCWRRQAGRLLPRG